MACVRGHVPHISNLDLVQAAGKVHRRVSCKSASTSTPEIRSYAQAWSNYVRGNIVSKHAARLITQFMAACCGTSSRNDDMAEPTQRGTEGLPDNSVSLGRVHRLLDSLSLKDAKAARCVQSSSAKDADVDEDSGKEAEKANEKALHRTQQMKTALQVTAALWDRNATPWQSLAEQPQAMDWGAQTTALNRKQRQRKLSRVETL